MFKVGMKSTRERRRICLRVRFGYKYRLSIEVGMGLLCTGSRYIGCFLLNVYLYIFPPVILPFLPFAIIFTIYPENLPFHFDHVY